MHFRRIVLFLGAISATGRESMTKADIIEKLAEKLSGFNRKECAEITDLP